MANPLRALLAFALFLPVPALAQETVTLRIAAEGVVRRAPDEIVLAVPVMNSGKTIEEARTAVAAKTGALAAALKAKGVPATALTLAEGRALGMMGNVPFGDVVSPEEVTPRVTVTSIATLRLADQAQLAAAQAALDAAGLSTMVPPTLALRDDSAARAAAGQLAIAKARKEADLYADALGMRVLRIVSVQNFGVVEGPDETRQMMVMMARMQGDQPREVETSVRVTVEYVMGPR